ncbi:MAG: phage/plasmid primase, P4 family [Sphaerochaetaceae bacterium]
MARTIGRTGDWFDDKGRFHFDILARHILDTCYAASYHGALVLWDEEYTRHISDDEDIDHMVRAIGGPIKRADVSEVCSYMYSYIGRELQDIAPAPLRLIKMRNGVLEIRTGTLTPPMPSVYMPIGIDHDWVPDAACKDVDDFLDSITMGDRAMRSLLEEMSGYCLYRDLCMSKMFLLVGDGHNGKSTFLNFLKFILGSSNVSAISFASYASDDSGFTYVSLENKLANISNEISDSYIKDSAGAKAIVSGDTITVAHKYQDKREIVPFATSIFACNALPSVSDDTGALIKDRIIPIRFKASFDELGRDVDISSRLCTEEAAEYMLTLMVEGLKRLLKRGHFEISAESKELSEEYIRGNDHYRDWLCSFDPGWKDTSEVWDSYRAYCIEQGLSRSVGSKNGVTRKLRSLLSLYPHRYKGYSVYEPISTKKMSVSEIQDARKAGWTGKTAGSTDPLARYTVLPPISVDGTSDVEHASDEDVGRALQEVIDGYTAGVLQYKAPVPDSYISTPSARAVLEYLGVIDGGILENKLDEVKIYREGFRA